MDLSAASSSAIITELKKRGYDVLQVHNTKEEALATASYTELVSELEFRGHSVEREDALHDFLFDLYYDACVKTPQEIMLQLNAVFLREINRRV